MLMQQTVAIQEQTLRYEECTNAYARLEAIAMHRQASQQPLDTVERSVDAAAEAKSFRSETQESQDRSPVKTSPMVQKFFCCKWRIGRQFCPSREMSRDELARHVLEVHLGQT